MSHQSQWQYERPSKDTSADQDPRVQEGLERFRHHDKTEHPPTDTEMGKTPARDSETRQAEHREKRSEEDPVKNLLQKPTERRVADAKKQADQYGRDMTIPQTYTQTLLDDQDSFAAPGNSAVREPREPVSLFPQVEKLSK